MLVGGSASPKPQNPNLNPHLWLQGPAASSAQPLRASNAPNVSRLPAGREAAGGAKRPGGAGKAPAAKAAPVIADDDDAGLQCGALSRDEAQVHFVHELSYAGRAESSLSVQGLVQRPGTGADLGLLPHAVFRGCAGRAALSKGVWRTCCTSSDCGW